MPRRAYRFLNIVICRDIWLSFALLPHQLFTSNIRSYILFELSLLTMLYLVCIDILKFLKMFRINFLYNDTRMYNTQPNSIARLIHWDYKWYSRYICRNVKTLFSNFERQLHEKCGPLVGRSYSYTAAPIFRKIQALIEWITSFHRWLSSRTTECWFNDQK